MKNSVCALVVAAGLSSRMQKFKPLLDLGAKTVLEHAVAKFLESGIETTVVVGWQKEKIISALEKSTAGIVENPDFQKGMFSSIQAGLRAIDPQKFKRVFILPVDIPLVRPSTLRRLEEAASKNPDKIIYPCCGGRRGHPPLLPSNLIKEILDYRAEGGLKAVLGRFEHLSLEVTVPDRYIHLDLDTPQDYERMVRDYAASQIPDNNEVDVIIFDICRVPPDRRQHCALVSKVAVLLADAFKQKGYQIDLDLVRAGGMLHDICKGQPDHAGAGARLLSDLGFGRTGEIVAAHSDLPAGISNYSLEAKIVYLADKFILGARLATLDERYETALNRFGQDPNSRSDILKRKQDAVLVKQQMEKDLGCPLEDTIKSSGSP